MIFSFDPEGCWQKWELNGRPLCWETLSLPHLVRFSTFTRLLKLFSHLTILMHAGGSFGFELDGSSNS